MTSLSLPMPAPFLIARSITSRVTLALRALSTTAASRGFPAGSAPPSFAATIISLTSFPTTWPFFSPATSRLACSHWRPIPPMYQLADGFTRSGGLQLPRQGGALSKPPLFRRRSGDRRRVGRDAVEPPTVLQLHRSARPSL